MIAPIPAALDPSPTDELTGLPPGLTDADAARVAAAISAVLVNRYIRPLEPLATTSSKDLGL